MAIDVSTIDLAARIALARGFGVTASETLAIAVSGGPDSIGLLALALDAFPGRVSALTVDHALRPGSAAEAGGVAGQCAARGVPHILLKWQGVKPVRNVQAHARAARYRLMGDWCAANGVALLLTAHTIEDQAETLLMRLARGSGSAGLAGVRGCRLLGRGVALVRPTLGLLHADLRAAAAGWDVVTDPSNIDPRFDRTRVRSLLARESVALPVDALAASAAHLSQVEAALSWVVESAWTGRAEWHDNALMLDAFGLPDELRRRLMVRALGVVARNCAGGSVGAGRARGAAVMRAIALLDSGRATVLGGVQIRPGTVWKFKIAAPRRQNSG